MNKNKVISEILSTLKIFIICFVSIFLINTFLVLHIIVDGNSMYPTLENREIGLTNVLGKRLNGVDRFDIVVVRDEQNKRNLIKRVIGLPNESISYYDNQLYINGEPVDEPFLNKEIVITGDFNYDLKDDQYWVLGDNRGNSEDSRYFGPISLESIKSKDVLILFPFDKIGVKK